jgi:hypothetical protein
MTALLSRGMVAPWVLQIEIATAPASRAYLTAIRVSIVSPDWLIESTRVSLSSTGSR